MTPTEAFARLLAHCAATGETLTVQPRSSDPSRGWHAYVTPGRWYEGDSPEAAVLALAAAVLPPGDGRGATGEGG